MKPNSKVDDDVLRKIEREVLDKHYQQFSLLIQNEGTALKSLFGCYATILRDLRSGKIPKPSDDAKAQTANEGLRGLGHCLRWVKERCPSTLLVRTPAPDVLASAALELLRWGVAYDPIWNQHSAYSRGLVDIHVDERNKSITFLPRCGIDPHYFCTQIEAKKAHDERLASARPDSKLSALSKTWCKSVKSSGQGMCFDGAIVRASGAIDLAFSWMEKACLPEIAGATRLLDCTVGDLRRVLATLYVYSLFVTKLEDVSDAQSALGLVLPPYVMAYGRDHMIDWLAGLSGVPVANVDAILSVLTFDPACSHVTVAQQPFVSSGDGRLFFLPRMVLFLNLPLMYGGALNKRATGRAVYAQTINRIESAGVGSIAQEIRGAVRNTIQVAQQRKFQMPDGQEIEPDMVVVWDSEPAVLVIDVKFSTPPFGPADIHRDLEEMAKWKNRMSEYVSSLQSNPGVLGQHFQWTSQRNITVFGLILPRWPLPIPVDFPGQIGAVDWPSLKAHIQQSHPSSIYELMMWTKKRPDVAVPVALAWLAKDVQVGEWKYRYSVLTPLPK